MRIAIDWPKRLREVAIIVGIGTFLSIIQPYGATSFLPLWQSWLYWTGLILYGSVVGMTVSNLALTRMDERPTWLILVVISTVTAVFVTPVLSVIHYLMGDTDAFGTIPMLFFFVWVISAAMTGVGWLLHRLSNPEEQAQAGDSIRDEEAVLKAFMNRLPLPYRTAQLYAISSEDHYLRVHTSAGEHMFLERLSTAVHQLDGANGLQTHRSWWVAETGVESARSQNGRIVLTLKSGVEVPVSRTYAPAVRAAGWM